jgi:4-hydroxybenzoyl-CoA reductase subunit beta
MLRLPEFEFVKPKSLQEAARLMAEFGNDAMIVAGGTDLYPKMKRGQFTPKHLVSLSSLSEIKGIRVDENGLWIGAGETLTAVARHPQVNELFPALVEAAGAVSSPQLRNGGTIGGNVFVDTRCNYYDQTFFWRNAAGFCMKKDGQICLVAPKSKVCLAVFSSDTAPVFCSLDATAHLVGGQGARAVPFSRLYGSDGINYIAKQNDELLQGITIPRSVFGRKSTYVKLARRGSFDFPVLGVAATLDLDAQGVCHAASLVLTAVASTPVYIDAEALLKGRKITAELIEAVGESAAKDAHPVDNVDMDYWYRKRMTKVYTKRALARLAGLETKPAKSTAGTPRSL